MYVLGGPSELEQEIKVFRLLFDRCDCDGNRSINHHNFSNSLVKSWWTTLYIVPMPETTLSFTHSLPLFSAQESFDTCAHTFASATS